MGIIENNKILTDNLRKNYNYFGNKENFTNFLTIISPQFSPANDADICNYKKIKDILMKYAVIFDFFEVRTKFISMIKHNESYAIKAVYSYKYVELE